MIEHVIFLSMLHRIGTVLEFLAAAGEDKGVPIQVVEESRFDDVVVAVVDITALVV